ncbi:glycosyltransferase [Nibricoccus sp. IMCC34717]|uniref:glycosyltransferase n=1 Tax=Nibricoccus sp. IMCC34717 TaxID=3034021 RepID=UPI00384DDF28
MSAQPPPFATIAICTYNRARWLRETLQFVTAQAYPKDRYEVIVVDNNSRDDTRAVVEGFAGATRPPRYVLEVQQGLSHARNRAIEEAQGDILLFIDDDTLGSPDWLTHMVEPFLRPGNENVGLVGGDVIPVFPEGLPRWLDKQWEPLNYRSDVGPLRDDQLPMGANFALRRGVAARVGTFRTDLGRSGTNLAGSEDHEFGRRVRAGGYEVWYTPIGGLQHQIPANRLTFKYAFKMAFDSARSRVVEKTSDPRRGGVWAASRIVTYLAHCAGCAAVSALSLVVLQIGWAKRWLCRGAKGLGYVVQCTQVLLKPRSPLQP